LPSKEETREREGKGEDGREGEGGDRREETHLAWAKLKNELCSTAIIIIIMIIQFFK
jgi:hypothetical protein